MSNKVAFLLEANNRLRKANDDWAKRYCEETKTIKELQSRIDRAVDLCRDDGDILGRAVIKILTEGDCKIVETKPQTKAKRSSK
jgi:predicted  nucleic acid-binding Zn ribbon protein